MRTPYEALSVLSFALATPSGAIGLPEVVLLTPDSAGGLGFAVLPTQEDGVLILKVTGPAKDPQGCRASRSGVALVDGGRELLVSITELPDGSGPPVQLGYSNHSGQLHMFIDYLYCPDHAHPRRYMIESADAFDPLSE